MAKPDKRGDHVQDPGWEAVIGLEVHVQLSTRTKMFCRCENRFGAPPNSLVCPVCLGHPGTLPVINEAAVLHATLAGLALGSEVARFTKFDRKNYYYPDLPKNYQISQYDVPICSGGQVPIAIDGSTKVIRLVRIHLEEDAGKNIHVEGRAESRVDLNRAGVPLLEIVSEPDLRTPAEAAQFLRTLRLAMLYLGISDCNMEEGSLRCDVNVSIRPRGSRELETRTELKNINSFAFVHKALEHEIARQIEIREAGGRIVQETRLYDPDADSTRPMRGKEEAHDYRYFPEPDLAPIRIEAGDLEERRRRLPRLPWDAERRFIEVHGLPAHDAEVLIQDPSVVALVESTIERFPHPKKVCNWAINDLFQLLNERRTSLAGLRLTPEDFACLLKAVEDKTLSVQHGREVFKRLVDGGRTVEALIAELGLAMISDDAVVRKAVGEVLAAHPSVVEDLRGGKKNALNFLVGQVMKATRGKANAGLVSDIIRQSTAAGAAPPLE
jgi:aspartyl-tRNA(Asn)/glutamyl-tRNA(Gln) amidotransferase subunit B